MQFEPGRTHNRVNLPDGKNPARGGNGRQRYFVCPPEGPLPRRSVFAKAGSSRDEEKSRASRPFLNWLMVEWLIDQRIPFASIGGLISLPTSLSLSRPFAVPPLRPWR